MPENTDNKDFTFNVEVTNPQTNESKTVAIKQVIPEKGRGAGNPKLLPADYASWNLATVVGLWGEDKVFKVLVKPALNQRLANFTSEATTKTEVKDGKEVETVETDLGIVQKDYSEMFRVLSQRGETVQALSRRLNEIEGTELPELLQVMFADNTSAEDIMKLKPQVKALQEERAEIKKSLAEKKAKSAKSEDDSAEEKPKAPVAA